MNITTLAGVWTYRSYVNNPELVGQDANKALALIFGEGTITLTPRTDDLFQGVLDMGGGYFMDLYGERIHAGGVNPEILIITGTGREGTSTANWVYQYKGYVVPTWAEGVNQVPAIVGTVIRTIPHNGGSAGVTASFVIVKH
jgi:hypothetical protein